jgi:hypothetical protein
MPAFACYSGLTIVPTADVTGANTYGLELQFDGDVPTPAPDTRILNTELGFGDRFEAGVDFDLSEDADPRTLVNAKYQLSRNTEGTKLLALGVCSVGSGLRASPYAVGTRDYGTFRGHLGLIRTDEADRAFVGVDKALDDRITAMLDYTAGDESYSSVGISYQHDDRFGVLAGLQFPNAGGETLFTVHLVLSGPYHLTR